MSNETYFNELCGKFESELSDIEYVLIAIGKGQYEGYFFNINDYLPLLNKIKWDSQSIDKVIEYCEDIIDEFNSIMDGMTEKEDIEGIKQVLCILLKQELTTEQKFKIESLINDYFE
jgi:hypothetical protein